MKRWYAAIVLIVCAGAAASAMIPKRHTAFSPVASGVSPMTVVLDAGHGGEDGGAIAADGTREKDINLAIADRTALFFDWFGIPYIATRTEDALIGDNTLPTVRERKVSDIRRRMELVSQTPGGVLLSIHQNYFLSGRYSGTQVFYAPEAPGSDALAERIQRDIVAALQPDNTRQIKPTEGTVFLLDKAEKTSVMVECGFLSNEQELARLKSPSYETQLAYFIARGLCDYFNECGDTAQQHIKETKTAG